MNKKTESTKDIESDCPIAQKSNGKALNYSADNNLFPFNSTTFIQPILNQTDTKTTKTKDHSKRKRPKKKTEIEETKTTTKKENEGPTINYIKQMLSNISNEVFTLKNSMGGSDNTQIEAMRKEEVAQARKIYYIDVKLDAIIQSIHTLSSEIEDIKGTIAKQQGMIEQLLPSKDSQKSESESEEEETKQGEPLSMLFSPKPEISDGKEMLKNYSLYKLSFDNLSKLYQKLKSDHEITILDITEQKDRQELINTLVAQMSTWVLGKVEISELDFKALMYRCD